MDNSQNIAVEFNAGFTPSSSAVLTYTLPNDSITSEEIQLSNINQFSDALNFVIKPTINDYKTLKVTFSGDTSKIIGSRDKELKMQSNFSYQSNYDAINDTRNIWGTDAKFTTLWNFTTDTMPASNQTLYGKWLANAYVLSFETNGADSGDINTQAVLYGELAKTPLEPTKLGHTFNGWYENVELTNA